jgi:hypothetical protein
VSLQDRQGQHHVVRGVADELAEGSLATLLRIEMEADPTSRLGEGVGQLGQLVVAADGDLLAIVRNGGRPHLVAQTVDPAYDRAQRQEHHRHDHEAAQQRERRRHGDG